MISAGTFLCRVEVFRPASSPDSMGGRIMTETSMGSRWANVAVPKARDNVLAMQGLELRTHVVTVRDKPEAPLRGDIISWRGVRLKILACRPDPANGCVYLDCESDKP